MKKLLLFTISILITANCFSQSPAYLWVKGTGGTGSDEARCVATDANGNIIVTGRFYSSTIAFGTTTLTNSGFDDMFIVKYDPSGNVLWAKNQDAGGTGGGNGLSVVADAGGNVILTGYFYDSTITFGTTTLTNLGSADIIVVKYDPNGNVLWAKQQDAGGNDEDVTNTITADADGNIIITGGFLSNSITFGTTTLTNGDSISRTRDIFIVKYDPNGNVLWAKQQDAGGSNADNAWGVAADASGNLFVTGHFFSPTMTFGTTTLTNADSSNTNNDMFIVKYDSTGNVLWAKQQDAGGSNSEAGRSVSVDASGNLIVTGSFNSPTITFGATTLTNAGSSDIFIVKYDSNGNVLWAKQQDGGGTGADAALSIAADANENVLVTGSFVSPTITFGTTTLTNASSSNIYSDIFIVKYDPNGNVLWAKKQTSGGSLNDVANSVATDAGGNIIVAGSYSARPAISRPRPSPAITITFGTTVLGASTGISGVNQNIFIAKLDGTTTGIENNTMNNEVSVYPNPTTGFLLLSNNYNITLSDLTGKIITKEQNANAIDISNQPAGMYFLLLTDNKGKPVQRSKVTKE